MYNVFFPKQSKPQRVIYGAGSNLSSELLLPEQKNYSLFNEIPALRNVADLFAHHNSSMFVLENGAVYFCGKNTSGAIPLLLQGIGALDFYIDPEAFMYEKIVHIVGLRDFINGNSFFITDTGRLFSVGTSYITTLQHTDDITPVTHAHIVNQSVKQVICGPNYTVIVTAQDLILFGAAPFHNLFSKEKRNYLLNTT